MVLTLNIDHEVLVHIFGDVIPCFKVLLQFLITVMVIVKYRVRNLKFATSKTLLNFMKKMMFLSQNWYFSVQKALIYYTVNKSHHNSFILLVFSHVANFRYVVNFTFLTL